MRRDRLGRPPAAAGADGVRAGGVRCQPGGAVLRGGERAQRPPRCARDRVRVRVARDRTRIRSRGRAHACGPHQGDRPPPADLVAGLVRGASAAGTAPCGTPVPGRAVGDDRRALRVAVPPAPRPDPRHVRVGGSDGLARPPDRGRARDRRDHVPHVGLDGPAWCPGAAGLGHVVAGPRRGAAGLDR